MVPVPRRLIAAPAANLGLRDRCRRRANFPVVTRLKEQHFAREPGRPYPVRPSQSQLASN